MGSPVTHWQMVSSDPEGSARFYGKLFGWQVSSANAMGYRTVDAGGGPPGGIWPAPAGAPSLVQLFVAVDDVARHVERALALGASLIVPVSVLPDGDTIAVVLDPVGLPFGLMQARSA